MAGLNDLARYQALPGIADILARLMGQSKQFASAQGLSQLIPQAHAQPLSFLGAPSVPTIGNPGLPSGAPPTYPMTSPNPITAEPSTNPRYGALDPFVVRKFDLGDWTGTVSNGAIPSDLMRDVPGTPQSTYLMQPQAAVALSKMLRAAHSQGIDLNIGGTYRDLAGQQAAYARYRAGGNLAATPGTSNHGLGLAVDLAVNHGGSSVGFTDPAYQWLLQNGPRFGFTNPWDPGQGEAWHWEFGQQTPPPRSNPSPSRRATPVRNQPAATEVLARRRRQR